tara:strand:- start:142 stop:423 length:282 start_codon:yes stop_codon:yes gene_type:complete
MDEPYVPKVNDYVVWDKGEYGKDEGWVYFFCEEYITIETGVRPKPPEQLDCGSTNRHKMIHTLLLCYANNWHQLKYIKSRKSKCPDHYSQCED